MNVAMKLALNIKNIFKIKQFLQTSGEVRVPDHISRELQISYILIFNEFT